MRLALCTLILFLLGCASTPPTKTLTAFQSTSDSQVRSSDHLLIVIKMREALEVRQVVDANGDISIPLVGKLRVAGMSLQAAATAIESAYQPQCFGKLRISVTRL